MEKVNNDGALAKLKFEEVSEKLGLKDIVVVGHSMGSLIAYCLAAQKPDLVTKMVLLGTSSPMPVTNLLLDAARDNHHAAIEMANTWSQSTPSQIVCDSFFSYFA